MATVAKFAASNVQGAVVPGAGHWLMEEQPAATVKIVRAFLDREKGATRPAEGFTALPPFAAILFQKRGVTPSASLSTRQAVRASSIAHHRRNRGRVQTPALPPASGRPPARYRARRSGPCSAGQQDGLHLRQRRIVMIIGEKGLGPALHRPRECDQAAAARPRRPAAARHFSSTRRAIFGTTASAGSRLQL